MQAKSIKVFMQKQDYLRLFCTFNHTQLPKVVVSCVSVSLRAVDRPKIHHHTFRRENKKVWKEVKFYLKTKWNLFFALAVLNLQIIMGWFGIWKVSIFSTCFRHFILAPVPIILRSTPESCIPLGMLPARFSPSKMTFIRNYGVSQLSQFDSLGAWKEKSVTGKY